MNENEVETPEPETEDTPAEPEEEEEASENEASGDEPDAAAEAREPETADVLEKQAKALEQAFKSYTSRVTRILEEAGNDFTPCPLCADPPAGFVQVSGAGRMPEEVKDVVRLYLGMTQEADYPADPSLGTCGRCSGLGQVRTGSKVPNFATLTCSACNGRGFVGPSATQFNGGASETPVLAPVGASEGAQTQADQDAWGSPRLLSDGMDNPNFGRMPQYKSTKWP